MKHTKLVRCEKCPLSDVCSVTRYQDDTGSIYWYGSPAKTAINQSDCPLRMLYDEKVIKIN